MDRRTKRPYKNIISGCLVFFLIVFLQLFVFAFFFFGLDDYFLPNPPAPTICEEDFGFEIIYAVNDKQYISNDTYVCKYEGFEIYGGGVLAGQGEKRRSWSGYIKGTGNNELILYEDEKIKLYCSLGAPGYYMGDKRYEDEAKPEIYLEDYELNYLYTYTLEKEDMKELYNVEIISFDIENPIENEFRYTLKSIFTWVK